MKISKYRNISIIKEKLTEIINICDDRRIEQILNKISSILNSFETKNVLIDNECYIVILQCTYLAKRLALKEKEENLYNLNFLLQRLDVVEDMFEVRVEKKDIIPNREEKVENTTLPFQISDLKKNLHAIDMQEIKTLRVDTVKLDNLIAQTGELLINGIKTREHLNKLSQINSKVNQWNSVSKKIINYLKYLEKKGFFNSEYDDGTNLFYKKAQAFFINNAETINEIQNDFGNLYKIMSEDDNKLHQTVMEIETIAKGIRVLPLATIFHSFPRMMRDIAKEKGKKIDFIVTGSDTTVDKKLIEEIKMPLIHILRNAVSHGIEIPEERINANKPETGLVRLSARHIENNVIITIEDDGYGINVEKVKQTALYKGLFTEEEINNLDNEQLMKLLFLPGFSTEDSVTEISGRGIGLDIVKTKINNLNGDIFIDSVINKGCKVSIKLPVSMSTIKTFVVMVNEQKYAVPINSIKFVKQINVEEIFKRNGQNYIIFDEHSVPVYSLSEVLGENYEFSETNKQLTVMIIENQERQAAFITDKLLGAQEVFHKKLVPPIIRVKNISGFTTLSTGEICLIINPYELIRNTVMSNYISVQNFKSIELLVDNYYGKDKRIVVLENEKDSLFHIEQELQNSFSKIEILNNINAVYEYFDKNTVDVLVVRIESEEDSSLNLVKYVKSDENLYKMFVIVVSTLDKTVLSTLLRGYFVDEIINPTTYDSDKLIKQIKDI